MKEQFIDFFEYNHHFNQKLIDVLSKNSQNISEKTISLINHLINSQQIWNARIINEIEFEVWQVSDWNQLSEMDDQNYKKTLELIHKMDLYTIIEYTNSKGIAFSNKIKDILFHIINHSTYHRAQIATELKQNGIEPLNTDYIFYKRKRE